LVDRAAVLGAQRLAGNRATAALLERAAIRQTASHHAARRASVQHDGRQRVSVQRQGTTTARDTKHPENFPTYEGWLGSFAALRDPHDTFHSHDKAPTGDEQSFEVLGDRPASRDPSAAPGDRPPDPIGRQAGDRFIDHPTDAWVRDNLPEELRQTAYRLPADCADIAVILRHVWLFAHRRSERYGKFVVGFLPGESDLDRSRRVGRDIAGINTPQVPIMLNAYTDPSGQPLRSVVALAPLLHPGDVLLWAHHAGPKGAAADPTRPRSGGHTQTIMSIERSGGLITRIVTLQGNEPLPKTAGEGLRHTPGRRIEVDELKNPTDLTIPAKGRRKEQQVWSFGDGHTTLVEAGPARSAPRPAARKEHGHTVRHLADWLPAIASATRERLEGVFEAGLREAQAMLEGGTASAEVEGEARSLGHAVRVRLDALDQRLAAGHRPPDPTTAEGIRATLATMRNGQTSTAPAAVTRVVGAVSEAFEATVRQPGWSTAGPSGLNAGERMVGHVRRVPVEGLPGDVTRAVVALPAAIAGGPQPVDVLLYFHGRKASFAAGRDIAVDRLEDQLASSTRRMVAVLPQGSAMADFGAFDADNFLQAVFAALGDMRIWSPLPPRGAIVVGGHSGGGKAAADQVTSGALAGAVELALFDGINGPDELAAVESWVARQLDAAADKLRLPGVLAVPAKEASILAKVPTLRAYHSGAVNPRPSRRKLDYAGLHATLRVTIADWFARRGDQLSPDAASQLRDHFQVIATGQREHERVVGGPAQPGSGVGALQDALTHR
jgi:hypothetical protein